MSDKSIRILKESDFVKMPWKNGGGLTTEIYRIDQNERMVLRVSSAQVSVSGPFSDYTGYERTLVNLGPSAMHIVIDGGHESELGVNQLIHFDGAAAASCRIETSTSDLNVFCDRDVYFTSTFVRQLKKPEFFPLAAGSSVLVYAIEGSLVMRNQSGNEYLIHAREAILGMEVSTTALNRWMLASASEDICVYAVIVFRKLTDDDSNEQ